MSRSVSREVSGVVIGFQVVRNLFGLVTGTGAKREFENHYGINLPNNFRVANSTKSPSFVLKFPRWVYPNTDGTRNKRRSGNTLIKPDSVVYTGKWSVSCSDPLQMYDLVVRLRETIWQVPWCEQEVKLIEAKSAKMRDLQVSTNAKDLHSAFVGNSRDFEYWCAQLLTEHLGWDHATVTQASSDGGVDIHLKNNSGETGVVECKAFNKQSVGRPILQKLQGAGAGLGVDYMLVMTTSTFSRQAIAYGEQHNIELFDGKRLLEIARKDENPDRVRFVAKSARILDKRMLLAQYPKDAKPVKIG